MIKQIDGTGRLFAGMGCLPRKPHGLGQVVAGLATSLTAAFCREKGRKLAVFMRSFQVFFDVNVDRDSVVRMGNELGCAIFDRNKADDSILPQFS